MLDEITFEILRHRLDAINDDAALVLARLSGSQLAAEARDLNTVIMAADGRVVCCGRYVLAQVVSMHLVVRDILDRYRDNPGIGPGDQFVTNDPYVGALHQPDVVVVAPVFVGGELVAWCGSTAHQPDVGGPNPGGITYDARSIFDEALPMPPVRLVEAGRLRADLEREYLIRSRTAELNRLDLLGQIAANRSVVEQLDQVCAQYGTPLLTAVLHRLLERAEHLFRERLSRLADGRFRHVSYVEHGDRVYAVRLTMTKRGDGLELDFSDSDPQAPGTVNAAYPALANFAIGSVLLYLCGGLLWVPGGIWPAVRIVSREGTVVHAKWPAGVAMSTASSCQAIRVCVNACAARLLETSEELSWLAMASCQAAGGGGGTIHGLRADGTPYATMTLDEITGGGGASWLADGADSSGYTTSPGASCANVEVNEAYLPLLYERRAELADTGGPGRHRGGVGTLHVIRPYRGGGPMSMMSFGQGLAHPIAAGVAGGEYGAQSVLAVLPLTDPLPLPPPVLELSTEDRLLSVSQGGGGLGDPLDRDPALVEQDIADGLVSVAGARRDYGVVAGDRAATAALREARRSERLGGRTPMPPWDGPRRGRRLSATLDVVDGTVCCARCGAPAANPLVHESPADDRAPLGVHYESPATFVLRRHHCPACATQLDIHLTRATDPPLVPAELL